MKATLLWTSIGLVFFSGVALVGASETKGPNCQKLAHDFAENSDSLNEDQLKHLQFCITQTLEQRYKNNPPELLRGTIIEPPSSSIEPPGTIPMAPSQNPDVQK
jgi:hypothetical protein